VATISRIDKIIGLFCRIVSLLWGSFAKETYDCIDPTNISHPICTYYHLQVILCTARFLEDETRNGERNANRNPEWWGHFSQMHLQIKKKFQFEFVPQDTSEFKSNQNLNSTLYREIPKNLIFSILTSWLKSCHHSGFRFAFLSPFRVSSSRKRAVHSITCKW